MFTDLKFEACIIITGFDKRSRVVQTARYTDDIKNRFIKFCVVFSNIDPSRLQTTYEVTF